MIRLTVSFWTLIALVVTAGCDDGETPRRAAGGPGAGGTGSGASGSGGSRWLYATDDEGVFPDNRVLDIKVTMPPDAWNRLIATATQEIWSTANVTIDGQSLGNVGFRPKGEYSLDSCVDAQGHLVCDKFSFKLKFNEIDPEGRFYGLKRLVLNQISYGSAVFAEPLGYQIFNDFGVVAPRTSYAVLTVNGESLGMYVVVEAVDGRFTDRHFPGNGDGNLYKEAWPAHTDDGYFRSALETNEETATNEAFIAFAADMLAAKNDQLPQTLAQHMDLGRLLDYMAVDYGIANWDGITTFYAGTWGHTNHNYYMYQDEGAARFSLIPWDLNATFLLDHWLGDIRPWDALDVDCNTLIPTRDTPDLFTLPATCDPTIRAIALSKDGYHASVRRLLDEVFAVERLSQKIDEYTSQVAAAMQNDPFVSYGEVTWSADNLKGLLPVFRSRLEAVLTGGSGGSGTGGTGAAAGATSGGRGGSGGGG
jgi:hypothetical protein